MYPTISHLLNDLLGINIPLPIQTFGFFMAVAFAAAYMATTAELKRKEAMGLLATQLKTITLNKRVTFSEYIWNVIIGAFIGYKIIDALVNYNEFVQDTQGFILSGRGSALGAIIGGAWAYYLKWNEDKEAAKNKIQQSTIVVHPYEHMTNIVFIAGIAGLLGAKIFHNLEYIDDFIQNPIDALLSFSGLTFYGGLIVAAVAVLIYTHKQQIPSIHMIDAAAPGLMLSYGIGRIGCHLSGDGDWGIVSTNTKPSWLEFLPDWVWSFKYPHNVLNEGIPIPGCDGRFCNELPQGVFPTPFYEVIMAIGIFFILWGIRKKITTAGVLFCIYLIFNGTERFLIEKIRVNSTYKIGQLAITQAEIISFCMILFGIVGIVYLSRKKTVA
jgi:phosphatidylglycerol---prolipoprotein diacylglyceryl transferase